MHSLQKFASAYASQNRCMYKEVEKRGCWKLNQRVVHQYIDNLAPYDNAKVASALCIGGSIKYKIKIDSGISVMWMLEMWFQIFYDSTHGKKKCAAETLALPLLWACFETEEVVDIPSTIQN